MVRYYLTHSIGVSKVAAKFNISDSQVYNWAKKFNEEGYANRKVGLGKCLKRVRRQLKS